MNFPAGWPLDCPPQDAEPADGEVYRLVKANPPVKEDFATHKEMGTRKNADPCMRCGLSVFRQKADAVLLHHAYPRLGKFIAKGMLQPEHGVTKQTGRPTHTTWWAYDGVDREALFIDVEEIV